MFHSVDEYTHSNNESKTSMTTIFLPKHTYHLPTLSKNAFQGLELWSPKRDVLKGVPSRAEKGTFCLPPQTVIQGTFFSREGTAARRSLAQPTRSFVRVVKRRHQKTSSLPRHSKKDYRRGTSESQDGPTIIPTGGGNRQKKEAQAALVVSHVPTMTMSQQKGGLGKRRSD